MSPSEELLRGLLAAAPDALLAVDADGRIVFMSDQAECLFGWTSAELRGESVERLVPERFRAGHRALRNGYFDHPVPPPAGVGRDLWALRKDGTEFPAEISLSQFITAEGPMLAAAIRDSTMARRTEQRFRALLASGPDAIVGFDAKGRIQLLNSQAERLFGWSASELLGEPIEVLVPDSVLARRAGRAIFAVAPSSRPSEVGMQLPARRKDGSTFPAEISLSSVDEANGAALVLAAVRDETERVELERQGRRQALATQQEQSHRLEGLGQLAGGVAHDFNNLLGVILNYTTLLERRFTDPLATADLGEIRLAAERAAVLTRQLLAFARKDRANPELLDVNEVVSTFASLLERTLGEQIQLRIDLAPSPLVVLADRNQLEQILLNLAVNSRDAMPTGGTLSIVTKANPPGEGLSVWHAAHATLDVIDTGEGMDADVLERAFEPFFTTKPVGEGTGLGLPTVFGIVGQNHGEVAIASTPGGGTMVSVALPLVDGTPSASVPAPKYSRGGDERILLVEDEGTLRVATERILTEHGYHVTTAVDGLDALEVFERHGHEFDLVVTDVVMPRLRGDEMLRRLVVRLPTIRVVFMSGYDSGRTNDLGPVLEKPVPQERLLRAIREVLDG